MSVEDLRNGIRRQQEQQKSHEDRIDRTLGHLWPLVQNLNDVLAAEIPDASINAHARNCNPKQNETRLRTAFYAYIPLVERGDVVSVVLKDGVLKKYLNTQKLSIYDDLTAFFASEPFRKISDELDAATKNVEEIKAFLASEGTLQLVGEFVKNDKKDLESIYVEEEEISGLEALEMDAFGVSINGTSLNAYQELIETRRASEVVIFWDNMRSRQQLGRVELAESPAV